jgi:hypothetical protein
MSTPLSNLSAAFEQAMRAMRYGPSNPEPQHEARDPKPPPPPMPARVSLEHRCRVACARAVAAWS